MSIAGEWVLVPRVIARASQLAAIAGKSASAPHTRFKPRARSIFSSYIPALRFRSLTRFYDPLLRAALKEEAFKSRLIRQARIEPGQRVLDLGCGTGTLTLMTKRAHPDAAVFGLDGDAEVLEIARRKAEQSGIPIDLRHGMASEPPFEPGSSTG